MLVQSILVIFPRWSIGLDAAPPLALEDRPRALVANLAPQGDADDGGSRLGLGLAKLAGAIA